MRTFISLLLAGSALSAQGPAPQVPPAQAPAVPAREAQPPAADASSIRPRPIGTMSELMVDVIYPTSDALFYVSTRTPENGPAWTEFQNKMLMLAESANLLMLPGRVRDQDQWLKDAKLLFDVGVAAYKAAKAKDVEALSALNDPLLVSCTTCHQHYRPNYGRRRLPQ